MDFELAVQKAQSLGSRMAKQGFHLEDNPYTLINRKLEASWADGFCKYCTMLSLAAHALAPEGDGAAGLAPPARGRAPGRGEGAQSLYVVG